MSLSVEGFSSALSATGLVRRNSYDFDFVEILGRFINNKTFAEGFQDYMTGRGTAGRDVWATLSAIGQDVGDELYRRVVHYIDDVSNSDTCRLQALKSMLKELGFEYTVFDSYKFMPAELQNAVDLMSISPCQLLRNGFMRDDFAAALCAEGVVDPYDTISALVSADAYACSDYFDMPGQASSDGLLCCFMLSSDGWISSDLSAATGLSTFTYDETAFSRYVENIYRSIIGGFLTMTYNNKAATPVYMSINKEDRYYNEDTFVKSRDIEDEPEDYGREDYYEFKA